MGCYACDQEAKQNCPRCGSAYCDEHGSEPSTGGLCCTCADPASAAPSSTVFRTSLFALLIASVVALWLLVRPPALPGESAEVSRPRTTDAPSATAAPTGGAQASPTALPASATPAAGSPAPGGTAKPTPTPGATPEPAEASTAEYTVLDGDTWYSIADAYGVDAETLAAANGRTLDDFIQIGETLVIP